MKVSVGISNRHVHLKEEDYKKLFGDIQLEEERKINQPNQYASKQFVTIKTNKNEIKNVRILGPLREYNQVEISRTDAYFLGINPPIRKSGDLSDAENIKIIGPNGEIEVKACIIADRHIHILPSEAKMYGLNDLNEVSVLIDGEKGGIIEHVHLRVSDASYFEMHLDTDDANAFNLKNGDLVKIVKVRK